VRIAPRKFGECGRVNSESLVAAQINCGFGVSAALGKQFIQRIGALLGQSCGQQARRFFT
jgi:hypothetical protein